MHILGKVLLWLSLLMVVGAILLTTMLLDTRARWLSEIEDRQAKLKASASQLEQAERTHRELRDERLRLTTDWGEVWMAANSGPQLGGAGGIELGVGSDSGLGRSAQTQAARPLYVFGVANQQQSRFLGEFQIVDQRPDRTAAAMTRLPYPGEVEAWPAGVFRVRENLPTNWLATFADLEDQYLVADSNLKAQQLLLANQTRQIQESQRALDQRLAELNGNPDAPEGAGPEIQLGLVETVRTAETARNEVAAFVDRQRRELDRMYVLLRKTLQFNREQVNALPTTPAADDERPGFPQARRDRSPVGPAAR